MDTIKRIQQKFEKSQTKSIPSNKQDSIILLGLPGSWKTTLGSLLTNGDTLFPLPDNLPPPEFPVAMTAENSNKVYYDFPDFTNQPAKSESHLSNLSLERLKIVLVAEQNNSQKQFLNLLEQTVTLVKQVDKFRNGIGMVFTQGESNPNEIIEFLSSVKKNTQNESQKSLIDILSSKSKDGYPKIACLKNLNDLAGIERMITENLQSTPVDPVGGGKQETSAKPTSVCGPAKKQTITGINLSLSEALEFPACPSGTKNMEIYAEEKLRIDTDLDGVGRNLNVSIVAPIWEIVGRRWIQLDGAPGSRHRIIKAGKGQKFIKTGRGDKDGKDGLPGKPGRNGGHFYGRAIKIINPELLRITADGGQGGPGQNGGDGAPGAMGRSGGGPLKWTKEFKCRMQGQENTFYYHPGLEGKKGGSRGRGGIGGYGGYAGTITIDVPNGHKFPKSSAKDGQDGEDGRPGLGGYSGRFGIDYTERVWWTVPKTAIIFEYGSKKLKKKSSRGEPSNCHQTERKKDKFETFYYNHSRREIPPAKNLIGMKGISLRPTFLDGSYFLYGLSIVDLIVRKCTGVKVAKFYDESEEPEISVAPAELTVRFEELLDRLRKEGQILEECRGFDPIGMIEDLKKLMVKKRWDMIRRMLIDRLVGFKLNPDIPLEHFVENVKLLLKRKS